MSELTRKLESNSMSIFEALNHLKKHEFVIPAFQRKFEWDIEKIECLWDSILQGFPISTFLLWEINEENSAETAFYHVNEAVEYKKTKTRLETNIKRKFESYKGIEKVAILDGQQRLNSLFLSLLGEIRITKDSILYPCSLIIELDESRAFEDDNDNLEAKSISKFNKRDIVWKKKYDIKFTTKRDLSYTEFDIKRILNEEFRNPETRQAAIDKEIEKIYNKQYASDLLNTLCQKIFDEKLINYTLAIGMNEEDALEMFVRFNSGGMKLTVAEITASILQVYWRGAEGSFDTFLSQHYPNFGYDFIIRTAHMLWGDVIKSNINQNIVSKLQTEWDRFCNILTALKNMLQDDLHINVNYFAKRWNVLLPIIYEMYNNPNYKEDILNIRSYLVRSVLFGYFRNGTTGKLSILAKRIKNQGYRINLLDLDDIPDLRVTDDKINTILESEYRNKTSSDALYFLSLDWNNSAWDYAKDHMHPQIAFSGDILNVSPEQKSKWLKMYNKLPNLQYLNKLTNERKNGRELESWLRTEEEEEKIRQQAYIPAGVSLKIQDFEEFYDARKEILKEKLITLLG